MEKALSVIKQSINNPRIQLALTIALISLMYFITLNTVPFHPDEATNLYMSDDLQIILQNPLSVSYQLGQEIDLQTHYRLMDPPVTRLYFGIIRLITNTPITINDWNWAMTWGENIARGNLPAQQTIQLYRIALLFLLPFICFFIYSFSKSLMTHWAAIVSMLIFAFNPLVLLHTRHAMPDILLMFFMTFLLMLLVDGKKHFFLVPIILSFALNSKQTAILLLPAYGIYLFWILTKSQKRDRFNYLLTYFLIPVAITFVLNPVSWSHPVRTIQAAIQERNALIQGNEYFLQQVQPGLTDKNITEKLIIVIYHTAYEPLALDDFPIYRENQQPFFDAYLKNPINNRSRNIVMGSLYVITVTAALILQGFQFWRERKTTSSQRTPWLFIFSGFISSLIGLSFLPSIYQRYVLILIPFTSLYTGWFIYSLTQKIKKQPV